MSSKTYQLKNSKGENIAPYVEIPQSFIDEFNVSAGDYGKYDPDNAPDPQHPFYLNELWLTYDEAILAVARAVKNRNDYAGASAHKSDRTLLIDNYTTLDEQIDCTQMFYDNKKVEVVRLTSYIYSSRINISNCASMFNGCTSLRKIITPLAFVSSPATNMFYNTPKLEYLRINELRGNLNLKDSPLVDAESFSYIVSKAQGSQPIIITVHADVYAKLTDTSNAEWNKILTDALAKNISFATA